MSEIFEKFVILNDLKDSLNEIKLLYVFGVVDKKSAFIITNNDKVFGIGSNDYGVLGFDNKYNENELKFNKYLSDKRIVDFKNGYNHVIARTIDGKVYCWGFNEDGVLGNGREDRNIFYPELNENLSDKQIIDICSGGYHSLALTKSGEVYAWGYNNYGQIGNASNTNQLLPIKLYFVDDDKIVMISCGWSHSLALSESGRIYSWGNNEFGQLGQSDNVNLNRPSVVVLSNGFLIKKISCGQDHNSLLTSNGDVIWFGNDGIDSKITPTIISNNAIKFIDITSHRDYKFSAALSVDGIYFVWGNCGEDSIKEPKETEFKSFDDIFAHYFGITYKTLVFIKNNVQNEKPENSSFSKILEIQESNQKPPKRHQFLKNISQSFNDSKYSDLKIRIEDKHIYVHKYVLIMTSKYFATKITESSRAIRESTENRKIENEIEIKEYSYDVYYAFLKYLYTECVDIESEKAMDLLILANDYKEEELKKKCFNIMTKSITIGNVCSLYCLLIQKSLKELEDYCFEFAFNNLREVLKTEAFQQMDENFAKIFKIKVFEKEYQ